MTDDVTWWVFASTEPPAVALLGVVMGDTRDDAMAAALERWPESPDRPAVWVAPVATHPERGGDARLEAEICRLSAMLAARWDTDDWTAVLARALGLDDPDAWLANHVSRAEPAFTPKAIRPLPEPVQEHPTHPRAHFSGPAGAGTWRVTAWSGPTVTNASVVLGDDDNGIVVLYVSGAVTATVSENVVEVSDGIGTTSVLVWADVEVAGPAVVKNDRVEVPVTLGNPVVSTVVASGIDPVPYEIIVKAPRSSRPRIDDVSVQWREPDDLILRMTVEPSTRVSGDGGWIVVADRFERRAMVRINGAELAVLDVTDQHVEAVYTVQPVGVEVASGLVRGRRWAIACVRTHRGPHVVETRYPSAREVDVDLVLDQPVRITRRDSAVVVGTRDGWCRLTVTGATVAAVSRQPNGIAIRLGEVG